jgi:hypothetical protein
MLASGARLLNWTLLAVANVIAFIVFALTVSHFTTSLVGFGQMTSIGCLVLWLLKDTTARAHPCLLPIRVIMGLREFLLIQEFMV